MKLGIIGTGYVGLVSGACFSDFGHDVICIDKDEKKIKGLINGIIPIYEPGLEALVKKNMASGRLKFSSGFDRRLDKCDIIFIAVGTPFDSTNNQADLSSVFEVVDEIRKKMFFQKLLVLKSTVPVGTNRIITNILNEKNNNGVEVVSNPEFLREGSALEDFMKPDRVIIGANSTGSKDLMREVYKPLYLRDFPIIFTDPESAEIIKYASNAFLATKITFINEIASLCEKAGGDIKEVAKGMGLDARIGSKFLHAGPGYGGSCLPKDTKALAKIGDIFGAPQKITETVIKVNNDIKLRMFDKIRKSAGETLDEKIICILGVTFKPETNDMREAPSLTIIPKIIEAGAIVRVVDPQGHKQGKRILGKKVDWYDSPYEAAQGADMIVILTEWNEFRMLNLASLRTVMRTTSFVDLRNIYSKKEILDIGFESYVAIGR